MSSFSCSLESKIKQYNEQKKLTRNSLSSKNSSTLQNTNNVTNPSSNWSRNSLYTRLSQKHSAKQNAEKKTLQLSLKKKITPLTTNPKAASNSNQTPQIIVETNNFFQDDNSFTTYSNFEIERPKTPIKLTKNKKKILGRNKEIEFELIENKYRKLTRTYTDNLSAIQANKHCEKLYEKGVEMMRKRQEMYLKNKEKKEAKYLDYSFSPQLYATKNKYLKSRTHSTESFYEKNKKWKESVNMKSQKILREREESELQFCTFTPKINRSVMENDNEFIEKNITQIIKYVKKRKNFLKKKEEDEVYKNKKFFENYYPHISSNKKKKIVKEFNYDESEKSFNKN